MTSAASAKVRSGSFDPETYRMSLGEHLEELRARLILGLLGFIVAFAVCLFYGNTVVAWFCRPLLATLHSRGLPPWMVDAKLGGTFMVYMRISMISAAALAAPWMVYQLWQFVASGLYPTERKTVTRYVPLSLALLIGGMVFVYVVVLPWTIQFFVDYTASMPIPDYSSNLTIVPGAPPLQVPVYRGDPDIATLHNGMLWFNAINGKLNIVVDGVLRSIPFAPQSLVVPQYDLDDYIDMVVMMLLMFGLAFQFPLAIIALVRIGILEVQSLRQMRRYAYFIVVVLAAMITPGDVITATVALVVPLALLYELGVFLAARAQKRAAARAPGD